MWLIDGDRVEVSNLNRQILFTEAEIGLLKVEAAAARLRAFNSAMRVTSTARRLESQAEIADFIAGADVVIDAADWPAHDIERWCNSACFEAGIPYITMSHFPPIARVGPLYVPGETGCFACQETAYRREYPLFDVAVEQRRAKASPAATLGPACGLIGGQVGLDVMHLLTGLAEPSTLGVAHIYDLRTMEVEREPVVPEPDCPVCGHLQPAAEPVEGDRRGVGSSRPGRGAKRVDLRGEAAGGVEEEDEPDAGRRGRGRRRRPGSRPGRRRDVERAERCSRWAASSIEVRPARRASAAIHIPIRTTAARLAA